MTVNEVADWWALVWYSGIAGLLLGLVWLLVYGRLVPGVHHRWVIDRLTKECDEANRHAEAMEKAVDRLADEVERRGRR